MMEIPAEWPCEIQESYEPIRTLGVGGFASVTLALEKLTENSTNTAQRKVAIKAVGGIYDDSMHQTAAYIRQQRDQAVLYARREIEILKHVHHPNIVRLFHHWTKDSNGVNKKREKTNRKNDLTAGILVLEYAKGPTVESLLKHGGALSTTFGRVVIAQTVDAIAYLHSHAVLHRDIKPDNILVTGALSADDSIWDNDSGSEIFAEPRTEPNWEALRAKYKVTLIDFGFARALTPDDVAKPSLKTIRKDSELASYHRICNDNAYRERTGNDGDDLGSSQRSTNRSRLRNSINQGILDSSRHRLLKSSSINESDELSRSITHKIKRTMSALGNRNFAAPEIMNEVRPQFRPRAELRLEKATKGNNSTTETISNYVADYGLLVDSYSMGHTIRYMMTGVTPGISVDDAIRHQRGGLVKNLFLRCLAKNKKKASKPKRSVRYRRMDELPAEICRLIGALTQISEKNRISIRKARWSVPWIMDVLESKVSPMTSSIDEKKEEGSVQLSSAEEPLNKSLHRISYLPFVKNTNTKPIIRESDATAATTLVDDSQYTVDLNPAESAPSF